MTHTPARPHPSTGDGGFAGDSTSRAFLKGAGVARAVVEVWHRDAAVHVKVHVATRRRNATDQVYAGQGGTSSIVRLTAARHGTAAKGYHGTITLGTDRGAISGAIGR